MLPRCVPQTHGRTCKLALRRKCSLTLEQLCPVKVKPSLRPTINRPFGSLSALAASRLGPCLSARLCPRVRAGLSSPQSTVANWRARTQHLLSLKDHSLAKPERAVGTQRLTAKGQDDDTPGDYLVTSGGCCLLRRLCCRTRELAKLASALPPTRNQLSDDSVLWSPPLAAPCGLPPTASAQLCTPNGLFSVLKSVSHT